MNSSSNIYLRCRIGREWYGINTDHVFKVLQMVALTEIPDARPDILGLLTLSDMVIPVIDLRRRFNLADAPLQLETPIVAIHTPQGAAGLVVDEADDIEIIDETQIELFSDNVSPYVVGIARCPDHLLLLLDTSLLSDESRFETKAGQ